MGKRAKETRRNLKLKLADAGSALGLSPTMFGIYMELFLSVKPIGLREIADATGYSVSTVCNNMEAIENLLDVRKFRMPGSKKEYYECQNDLTTIYRKKITCAREVLPRIVEALRSAEEGMGSEDANLLERIVKRRRDYERLGSLLDAMEVDMHARA